MGLGASGFRASDRCISVLGVETVLQDRDRQGDGMKPGKNFRDLAGIPVPSRDENHGFEIVDFLPGREASRLKI